MKQKISAKSFFLKLPSGSKELGSSIENINTQQLVEWSRFDLSSTPPDLQDIAQYFTKCFIHNAKTDKTFLSNIYCPELKTQDIRLRAINLANLWSSFTRSKAVEIVSEQEFTKVYASSLSHLQPSFSGVKIPDTSKLEELFGCHDSDAWVAKVLNESIPIEQLPVDLQLSEENAKTLIDLLYSKLKIQAKVDSLSLFETELDRVMKLLSSGCLGDYLSKNKLFYETLENIHQIKLIKEAKDAKFSQENTSILLEQQSIEKCLSQDAKFSSLLDFNKYEQICEVLHTDFLRITRSYKGVLAAIAKIKGQEYKKALISHGCNSSYTRGDFCLELLWEPGDFYSTNALSELKLLSVNNTNFKQFLYDLKANNVSYLFSPPKDTVLTKLLSEVDICSYIELMPQHAFQYLRRDESFWSDKKYRKTRFLMCKHIFKKTHSFNSEIASNQGIMFTQVLAAILSNQQTQQEKNEELEQLILTMSDIATTSSINKKTYHFTNIPQSFQDTMSLECAKIIFHLSSSLYDIPKHILLDPKFWQISSLSIIGAKEIEGFLKYCSLDKKEKHQLFKACPNFLLYTDYKSYDLLMSLMSCKTTIKEVNSSIKTGNEVSISKLTKTSYLQDKEFMMSYLSYARESLDYSLFSKNKIPDHLYKDSDFLSYLFESIDKHIEKQEHQHVVKVIKSLPQDISQVLSYYDNVSKSISRKEFIELIIQSSSLEQNLPNTPLVNTQKKKNKL